jgi:signal transduction histidine kinase
MKKKQYLLFSALGFLTTALLTFCLSLADFPLAAINEYDIARYTQNLHKRQQYICQIVEKINPEENVHTPFLSNTDKEIAIFIFKNENLLRWIHDAPIEEEQLLQIDTIFRFVKLNNNWYIARTFYKRGYRIVVTDLVKKELLYVDQSYEKETMATFPMTNDITVGPPCADHGVTINSIEGHPLVNLYSANREAQHNIHLLLRWIAVIFLLISIFLLFQYSGRYKTVPLFILLLISLRAVLFFTGGFLKHRVELFAPYMYSESAFLCSLGELLLHAVFFFFIVAVIYKRRKLWEIYMSRTTRVKRICWIIGSIVLIVFSALAIHYILRSLIFHSIINLKPQHLTELNFYSLIAYLILAILFSTLFLMVHVFLRCTFPTWLNAWKKQTFAMLYILLISVYTTQFADAHTMQFDQHRNAIWAYKLAVQHKEGRANPNFSLPSNYSYAIFFNKTLVDASGSYNYYRNLGKQWDINKFTKISKQNEYIHYVYNIHDEYIVILSHKEDTLINYAAAYSYLFLFYSLLFYTLLHFAGWRYRWVWKNNALRRKITFSLLGLVIFSLVMVCAGSLIYNIAQYKAINSRQISERIKSTLAILNHELNTLQLHNIQNTPELAVILTRIANSFDVDINIYDTRGKLLISSMPEVFSEPMQSTRINSDIMMVLERGETSQVIRREKIGQFDYMSVYVCHYNRDGLLNAYINLPYFINQKEITEDISTIITSYANVYIILIIITLIISIILSNQITQPLHIIRQNMKLFERSGKLEPIDYNSSDEVGDLIRSYNEMIITLDNNNRKLAQAERESAWRDIARQIAHEVKNPLTPMRLSIQHLLRMKQDNAPGWEKHFEEVSHTWLEQIETLSNTASEFSSFAKIGQQESAIIDLNTVIKEQISLFNNHPNITFSMQSQVAPANVSIRYEQLNRVFVNILTNAVQAIDGKENGQIIMTLYAQDNRYYVAVEDNGCGIGEEEREKLFTPNFTTKSGGNGLGLVICHNIMENYGGSINYSPSALGGACFTISLPAIRQTN